jgi:hypothetical protein
MKRLTNTLFFLMLKRDENNLSALEQEYDKFVSFLFSESEVAINKTVYHNTLVYTRTELAGLTEMSEKKMWQFI